MILTIAPTPAITTADGVRGRVWEGEDEHGVPVILLVTRIAVDETRATPAQLERFRQELLETSAPREPDIAGVLLAHHQRNAARTS